MQSPTNILLALDLYDNYQLLLNRALQLARTYRATLNIVHVIPHILSSVPYAYDFQTDLEIEAKEKMSKIQAEVSGLPLHTYIKHGTPKNEIVHLAEELKVDLLIVGSHGKHGLDLLLGSTANGILHIAKCNVLTIHIDSEGNPTTTGQYQRVLLAADLHNDNQVVVDSAKALSKQFAAELFVINVVPDAAIISSMYTPQLEIDLQAEAKPRMEQLGKDLQLQPQHTFIAPGHPKTEILHYAKHVNADLIVIGSHGRHGLTSALLGSTANAVLHGAKSDVLVVRIK
jgi:nucleotide-binding universal stress UspA family protein